MSSETSVGVILLDLNCYYHDENTNRSGCESHLAIYEAIYDNFVIAEQ